MHANFDWRAELEEHKLARSFKAGLRANTKKATRIFAAVGTGEMTLREVREAEPDLYFSKGTLSHLQKLRGDFLTHQAAPESVINFYIFGPGGVGKDLLAKALARMLSQDGEKPYFKVGGENVSWEGYDGEDVVIWEECRVGDMINIAKSRGMLFRILGPWREPDEKPVVNIKNSHTQLLNRANIVTGPADWEEFLRGLAGEYESMHGGIRVKHRAENLGQGYRRFPLIIPVSEGEFGVYVSLGFLNGTREYQSYERYEHLKQDLETLRRRCKAISDEAERIRVVEQVEQATVAPIMAQYDRLLGPPADCAAPEDVLAEFADVGMPIQIETRLAPLEAERTPLLLEIAELDRGLRPGCGELLPLDDDEADKLFDSAGSDWDPWLVSELSRAVAALPDGGKRYWGLWRELDAIDARHDIAQERPWRRELVRLVHDGDERAAS